MSRCNYCDRGYPVIRSNHYDGSGSWRRHKVRTGYDDPIIDVEYPACAYNSWFSRHRLLTAFIALYLIGATLVATQVFASTPPKLPAGATCEQVRAKVSEHGKVIAYAWARLQGYSKREIAEARRCLISDQR